MTKKSFWKDGLTVSETKFSLLALLLVIGFVYGIVDHFINGDIAINLLDLINGLLLAFVGVNAVDRVSSAFEKHTPSNKHHEGEM